MRRGQQRDIASGTAKTLAEIGSGVGIETEIEPVNMSNEELEKFMAEPVTIVVHKTNEKGALNIITPSVNGRNQPIIRGIKQTVRRCYVEALIGSHQIEYEQQINPLSPDQFKMNPKATPSYPFDVVNDTEEGYAWKERLERRLDQEIARI